MLNKFEKGLLYPLSSVYFHCGLLFQFPTTWSNSIFDFDETGKTNYFLFIKEITEQERTCILNTASHIKPGRYNKDFKYFLILVKDKLGYGMLLNRER